MAPPRSMKGNRRARTGGTRAALVILATLVTLTLTSNAATAAEYPSWSEVEQARNDEAAKQSQIQEIAALISELELQVMQGQQIQERRAGVYEKAQATLDEATFAADQLQVVADQAAAEADGAKQQAGRVAASLTRSVGADPNLGLLLEPGDADDFLSRLGSLTDLAEKMADLQATAAVKAKTAGSLIDQAVLARNELQSLAATANAALQEAVAANEVLEVRRQEQQTNRAQLEAQLAVLNENREATEADFEKGRQAQEAANTATPSPNDRGQLNDQGWALPVSGWISDAFGPRPVRPAAGVGAFHYGTDIAAGCGVTVYAATAGTVEYSGWLGTYGNWVLIDHGSGVQTGYAHNSELLVSRGERVEAGQPIALVGSTGASSGCHLHFETRVDGARIDPQPFMAGRGIGL